MADPLVLGTLGAAGCLVAGAALVAFAFRNWYVAVAPDEFVVHYRRGRVVHLGRGSSFLCLPGDTYLKVPSTIRDINFAADQITQEKQGVRVQGFLAYKIADFELAYQSLDLKSKQIRVLRECADNVAVTDYKEKNCEQVIALDPEDPLAKTDLVLRRLAESVVRHEVSNKTVDEMITERESVIRSMRDQLQETVQHWGIEIDTIEFTEVWIRSKELFEHMQAEHRNVARLKAARSTTETDRQIAESRVRTQQEIASLEAEAERARRIKQSEEQKAARATEITNGAAVEEQELSELDRIEKQRLALEKERERLKKETEHRLKQQELEQQSQIERRRKETVSALKQQELDLAAQEELKRIALGLARQQEDHAAELDRRTKATELEERALEKARRLEEIAKQNALAAAALERQLEEARLEARLEAERMDAKRRQVQVEAEAAEIERRAAARRTETEEEAEGLRRRGAAEAEALRLRHDAENSVNPAQLKKLFIEGLPRVAESMRVKDVRWVNLGGTSSGGGPMEMIPSTLAKVMGVFQGMGLDLDDVLRGANSRPAASLPEAGEGRSEEPSGAPET